MNGAASRAAPWHSEPEDVACAEQSGRAGDQYSDLGAGPTFGPIPETHSRGSRGQPAATASSNNLTINGEPYTRSLQISGAPPPGDQRQVTVTSRSFSPAHLDSRMTEGTVTWVEGSGCITVDDQTQSTRGSLSSTSTVSGDQRRAHQCPSAGTVRVEASEGAFTTTFNGSSTVQVTAPNGDNKSFNLDC